MDPTRARAALWMMALLFAVTVLLVTVRAHEARWADGSIADASGARTVGQALHR